jgi:hypothetical protein
MCDAVKFMYANIKFTFFHNLKNMSIKEIRNVYL